MGSFTNFVGDQLNDMRAHSAERAMAENEIRLKHAGNSRERNSIIFNQSKQELNALIDKAKPEVLKIKSLPLPKDEIECQSMLEEAKMEMETEQIVYVMEPPTMEDEGGKDSPLEEQIKTIDWKKGSTMICEAWKIRYDRLVKIAKSTYPDAEFTKKAIAYNKKRLIKNFFSNDITIGIIAMICSGLGLLLLGVIGSWMGL